jgi:hypothetical protein
VEQAERNSAAYCEGSTNSSSSSGRRPSTEPMRSGWCKQTSRSRSQPFAAGAASEQKSGSEFRLTFRAMAHTQERFQSANRMMPFCSNRQLSGYMTAYVALLQLLVPHEPVPIPCGTVVTGWYWTLVVSERPALRYQNFRLVS